MSVCNVDPWIETGFTNENKNDCWRVESSTAMTPANRDCVFPSPRTSTHWGARGFHHTIGYYIEHATRVGGRKRKTSFAPAASTTSPTGTAAKRDPAQTRAIRQWAADNGYEISDRGRIPAAIEEAFNAAH